MGRAARTRSSTSDSGTRAQAGPLGARWSSSRCLSNAYWKSNAILRKVVAQEDVDVDPLLIGHDGIAEAVGEQDARGGARLMTGVLVDDRVDHAAEEKGARMHRQLVGDPDDVVGAA